MKDGGFIHSHTDFEWGEPNKRDTLAGWLAGDQELLFGTRQLKPRPGL